GLVLIVGSMALYPSAVIAVSLEGECFLVETQVTKVETVLKEAGVKICEEDIVSPPLHSRVSDGDTIVIKKQNTPLVLILPEKTITTRTAADTIGEALDENGVVLSHDYVLLKDGLPQSPENPLAIKKAVTGQQEALTTPSPPRPYGEATNRGGPRPHLLSPPKEHSPVTLRLKRAVPVQVHDSGLSVQVMSTEETLSQALDSAGITINPGDLVTPGTESPVQAGMHVYIQRSKGVTLRADGTQLPLRTFSETVAQVLAQARIHISELDRVVPDLDATITDGLTIDVTRIVHEVVISEEPIPFSSELRPDPDLEIDHIRVAQIGKPGLSKTLTKTTYENGKETERVIEREWVESEPQTHITTYGQKIVLREIDTPEGRLSYWRKLRVFATAYDATCGDKERDHPAYGITRLGLQARKGIVAVDPQVIPFYTKMFVPGYGVGLAADTGEGIRGRWVDLCYEEGQTDLWGTRWIDIYLLDPPPQANSIRWIIP
ncbi:MAG: ubiquitin-like domain-containing protein, partial [Chloroflexota bacterium]